ncbi:heavy-metal-associated domain-containing protein [Geomesophilobacter sediminis]|uniref:Heavy-metal-associated domain-containing protein n=1 Tax=Geomesophilobacter sediminis TaxID=2798584 RepID=A0A8J7M3K7_9BACT|nr:heavy-metal-associated domain-containing protein [Geomesophilobacter sediminis]MBJ6727636.1 heavy-metal-associated domain-containing protein [Geomesophilobacter sediminis]
MARPRIQNVALIIAAVLILIGFGFAVRVRPTADRVALLSTRGMTGGCCTSAVQKVLQSLRGVASVRIDRAEAKVIVGFDSRKTAPVNLAAAVSAAGYPTQVQKVETVEEFRSESAKRGGPTGPDQTAQTDGCGGCCSQNRN